MSLTFMTYYVVVQIYLLVGFPTYLWLRVRQVFKVSNANLTRIYCSIVSSSELLRTVYLYFFAFTVTE